jgi:hypothetical protein
MPERSMITKPQNSFPPEPSAPAAARATSDSSPDLLLEGYLNLALQYRHLELASLMMKAHIEFAVRHIKNIPASEELTKEIVIERLIEGVQRLDLALDLRKKKEKTQTQGAAPGIKP